MKNLKKIKDDKTKINNIAIVDNNNNLEIKADDNYFSCKMYLENTWDAAYYTKFIKNIEKIVRTSDDYSSYIAYLKDECKLTRCSILGNVTDEMAEIPIHHYPFTLYDICSVVTLHRMLHKEPTSTILVAKEVLDLHYNNMVGVVPLCNTVHTLVHSGLIFLNLNQVFGNVFEFIKIYKDSITEDMILKYNDLVKLSKKNVSYSENDILELSKTSWITKTPSYYKDNEDTSQD